MKEILEKLKTLQPEIHCNAVKKGWWETERDIDEVFANIHGELSEAWEHWRNKEKLDDIFFWNPMAKDATHFSEEYVMTKQEWFKFCKSAAFKPDGIPIELADTIIRILDYAYYNKLEVLEFCVDVGQISFPQLIVDCHYKIAESHEYGGADNPLNWTIAIILCFCHYNSIDILQAIELKHAYNKTRPYRHGGKVA